MIQVASTFAWFSTPYMYKDKAVFKVVKEEYDTYEMKVISIISKYYKIHIQKVLGKKRFGPYVKARHMCFYFLRLLTDLNFSEIGMIFNADHTTVMYGEKSIKSQLSLPKNNPYKTDVEALGKLIESVDKPVEENVNTFM